MSELSRTTFISDTDTINFCAQLDLLRPQDGLNCGRDQDGNNVIEYMVTVDPYPIGDSRDISNTIFEQSNTFTLSEST